MKEKANFITTSVEKANEYLLKGWTVRDYDVKASVGNLPSNYPKGLSEYGIEGVKAAIRLTERTFILEMKNAVRCAYEDHYYTQPRIIECKGCEKCDYTGWLNPNKMKLSVSQNGDSTP